jgi:hypothetical protein
VAKQKKSVVSLKPKLKRKAYEKELQRLQAELCHLQEWVKHTGERIIVVLEGSRRRRKRRHHQGHHRTREPACVPGSSASSTVES